MSTEPGRINDRWDLQLTPDRVAFHEARPRWEIERLASMFSELTPGQLLVDVGAECGDFLALHGTWGLKVAAIEPAAAYWPSIRAHCDANGVEPEWCFDGFAGPHWGDGPGIRGEGGQNLSARINIWPDATAGPIIPDAGFAHLCARPGETDVAALDLLSAAHLVNLLPARYEYSEPGAGDIHAITIDVEGSEFRVLQGAVNTIKRCRPLVWVAIHTDAAWMEENYKGENEDAIRRLFDECEYDVELLAESHERHLIARPR